MESYLDKLERREQALIAKCQLQEGRLGRDSLPTTGAFAASTSRSDAAHLGSSYSSSAAFAASVGAGTTVSALKMNQVRQKKERLSYAIDRLQLQAQQRERQLRKSLAAPQLVASQADDDIDF